MNELLGQNLQRLDAVSVSLGINRRTLLRWVKRGLQDRDGNQVRLRALRIGARYWLDRDDVRRFIERLNRQSEPVAAA
jgi:hypothetical protein